MPRFVQMVAVLAAVGIATPALAHCRNHGVGIQLGGLFIGHRHHHCQEVVVVQAAPVVTMYAQPVYAAPPPPPVVMAPPQQVVYSNPPIVYAQPVVVQQQVRAERPERPGFLALKYMPGISSNVSAPSGDVNFSTPTFAHSPGIELRLTRWLSLRSDLEFRKESRTWDMLGVKLSPLPNSIVKPYASVSFSGNENLSNPGRYSFGFAGAAGIDVLLGKNFFLEAEARYRMTPGSCCSDVPSVTGVVGGGVAFF